MQGGRVEPTGPGGGRLDRAGGPLDPGRVDQRAGVAQGDEQAAGQVHVAGQVGGGGRLAVAYLDADPAAAVVAVDRPVVGRAGGGEDPAEAGEVVRVGGAGGELVGAYRRQCRPARRLR